MNKKRIILATQNPNKLKEMQAIFKHYNIEIISPPSDFDPIESGKTFHENAYIKASEASKLLGFPSLADDSGLAIEELNGEPGIHSARYAPTNEERIQKVLKNLKNKENRNAKFVCSMVLTDENGNILHSTLGECEGEIIKEKIGENGFGYDPIFFIPELNKTMAELTMSEKNKVSHRSKALKAMIEYLQKN